jgi:hypothetical protein
MIKGNICSVFGHEIQNIVEGESITISKKCFVDR